MSRVLRHVPQCLLLVLLPRPSYIINSWRACLLQSCLRLLHCYNLLVGSAACVAQILDSRLEPPHICHVVPMLWHLHAYDYVNYMFVYRGKVLPLVHTLHVRRYLYVYICFSFAPPPFPWIQSHLHSQMDFWEESRPCRHWSLGARGDGQRDWFAGFFPWASGGKCLICHKVYINCDCTIFWFLNHSTSCRQRQGPRIKRVSWKRNLLPQGWIKWRQYYQSWSRRFGRSLAQSHLNNSGGSAHKSPEQLEEEETGGYYFIPSQASWWFMNWFQCYKLFPWNQTGQLVVYNWWIMVKLLWILDSIIILIIV